MNIIRTNKYPDKNSSYNCRFIIWLILLAFWQLTANISSAVQLISSNHPAAVVAIQFIENMDKKNYDALCLQLDPVFWETTTTNELINNMSINRITKQPVIRCFGYGERFAGNEKPGFLEGDIYTYVDVITEVGNRGSFNDGVFLVYRTNEWKIIGFAYNTDEECDDDSSAP